MAIALIFGISFLIGGVIGIANGIRIRRNRMTNYYLQRIYPVVKTDGEVIFTPYGVISYNIQEKED